MNVVVLHGTGLRLFPKWTEIQPWALQAAEKLIRAAKFRGFVTGHDFSRADKPNQINVGL